MTLVVAGLTVLVFWLTNLGFLIEDIYPPESKLERFGEILNPVLAVVASACLIGAAL